MYRYAIDGATASSLERLKMALISVPGITRLKIDEKTKVLAAFASFDPGETVRRACDLLHVRFIASLK
ncbi:MAG TPA: hypothetical protein VL354_02585 [Spirochaetia bacterium]|nr:hypothetical protein [Spirochaetia bacterium]